MVFEGVRGISYRGDIAIDDIKYTPTPCKQSSKFFEIWLCFDILKANIYSRMAIRIFLLPQEGIQHWPFLSSLAENRQIYFWEKQMFYLSSIP